MGARANPVTVPQKRERPVARTGRKEPPVPRCAEPVPNSAEIVGLEAQRNSLTLCELPGLDPGSRSSTGCALHCTCCALAVPAVPDPSRLPCDRVRTMLRHRTRRPRQIESASRLRHPVTAASRGHDILLSPEDRPTL